MIKYIDIVFDGPPGHGRFVEVVDDTGKRRELGQWTERPDGFWVIRIKAVNVPITRVTTEAPTS